MQKIEVECTFQKPSLASLRDAHRPGGWDARGRVGAKPRSGAGTAAARVRLPRRRLCLCFVR